MPINAEVEILAAFDQDTKLLQIDIAEYLDHLHWQSVLWFEGGRGICAFSLANPKNAQQAMHTNLSVAVFVAQASLSYRNRL